MLRHPKKPPTEGLTGLKRRYFLHYFLQVRMLIVEEQFQKPYADLYKQRRGGLHAAGRQDLEARHRALAAVASTVIGVSTARVRAH
jgi:hypothetical protein